MRLANSNGKVQIAKQSLLLRIFGKVYWPEESLCVTPPGAESGRTTSGTSSRFFATEYLSADGEPYKGREFAAWMGNRGLRRRRGRAQAEVEGVAIAGYQAVLPDRMAFGTLLAALFALLSCSMALVIRAARALTALARAASRKSWKRNQG